MARGTVKSFSDEEAWGVLTSPEVPGEVWVHIAYIKMDGYRVLRVGQAVDFEWEHSPPGQDGFFYRAYNVRPV